MIAPFVVLLATVIPLDAAATVMPPAAPAASEVAPGEVGPTHDGECVLVTLRSGRQWRGALDARTDVDRLWLRWQRPGIELSRPVAWDEISSFTIVADPLDLVLSGDEARQLVAAVRREVPRPAEAARRSVPSNSATLAAAAVPTTHAAAARPPRIRSIAIDAWTANFEANGLVDGLVVDVTPLDDEFAARAVDGSLEVELFGLEPGPNGVPRELRRLGLWSQRLTRDDFVGGTARVRLPWQGLYGELERDLMVQAAARAKLSVPGQGTFEATDAMVRLRPYSAFRDWLELTTGHRDLPGEPATRRAR